MGFPKKEALNPQYVDLVELHPVDPYVLTVSVERHDIRLEIQSEPEAPEKCKHDAKNQVWGRNIHSPATGTIVPGF